MSVALVLNITGLGLQVFGAWSLLRKARAVRDRIDAMPNWSTYDGMGPFLEALRDNTRGGFADQSRGFGFFLAGVIFQLLALFG